MKRKPVIIDCDPGHDDMMALVMAYGSQKLDIRAVTTVAGNNTIENTTRNALNVLHYVGADDIPVAMGFQDPIVRSHKEVMEKMLADRKKYMPESVTVSGEKIQGASAHGISGLDGFCFPEYNPMKPAAECSVEMMAKVLRESEEKVTIISTGPLTNLGLLLRGFPDLVGKIQEISMMGGTSEFVLTRPFMEFNTFVDPEATRIVFNSGVPITMYGYDVTYRVLYSQDTIDQVRSIGNQTGAMVSDLLNYFMVHHNGLLKRLNLNDTAPIHDACAVAGVIDSSLVTEAKDMHVDVELGGHYFDGATICDYTDCMHFAKNVRVVYNMDVPRFLQLLIDCTANCK